MVVFSLTGWSPCLPSGFLVSRRTPDPARPLHNFAYGIVTLSDLPFKVVRLSCQVSLRSPYPAGISTRGLGSSDFARHYFRNRFYFLFLRVLRCFSSPGSPYIPMDSVYNNAYLYALSSLIRISAGHWIFAPHRSFSQLVTSFFGAMYQGIPRMLFVAWSFLSISIILSYSFKIYSSSLQKFYTSNSSYSRLIFSYSKNSNCKIVTSFSSY